MADLDFSRSVPDVPASSGPNTPAPYHRTESVQPVRMPDFQSAISNYADATNWMSFIGSAVASKASDAIATKIGGELGKNPQGNIGIPITDFDKTMQQSYNTQAQATLSLQANKLITDSNIETAKASRITPELVAKTNQNITAGLQGIIKNAPDAVKPSMELQFGNAMIHQSAELSTRMIREQKEDQRNNNAYASDMNAQHAYSFGVNGNEKAGLAAVENTRSLNEASVAARLITPEDAKSNIDSARKSYLSGKLIHGYNNSTDKEAYLKSIADKKPDYLSDNDYMSVTQNLLQYVNQQHALRAQDEQLRVAKFNVSLQQNPMAPDMASQIQDLKNNVSPATFEKAHLSYISSLEKFNKENGDLNNALTSWNDPTSFSRLSEKGVNKAFDTMVNQRIQQGEMQGRPVSREDAEVEVAASAGGSIPVFTKAINNKLASPNPVNIESAGRQISRLTEMNAGNALRGITPESKAVYTKYQSLRDSMEATKAAQLSYETVYNQDPAMIKANNEKWTNFLSTKKSPGQSPDVFALNQVGLNSDRMRSPTVYGNDILEEYKTYFTMLNGDQVNAKKMLDESVKQNYGDTYINGKRETTKHPIEKVLNLPESAIGVVQQDISEQLQRTFDEGKKRFDSNEVNEYWEIAPRKTVKDVLTSRKEAQANLMKQGFKKQSIGYESVNAEDISRYNKGAPIQVIRHMRGGKRHKYNVVIQMNPFASLTGNEEHPIEGGWDISVDGGSGIRNLYREAPYLGLITYTPNLKSIQANRAALLKKG